MPASLSKIPAAQDFIDRIQAIGDNLLEVARDLAAAIDLDPGLPNEIQTLGMDRDIIRRFERLGRGQIHQSLVFTTTPGGSRLITVPLSEQTLAISGGVEVLDSDEETIRNIPVHELASSQASQVIARGHIRTIAEQRTWIRAKKKNSLPVDLTKDFRVGKDHVAILSPGKFSKQLILQWLTEMN